MLRRLTHMISCKEASRLLSQGQDRRLSFVERLQLWLHMTACDACTRFATHLRIMRAALSRFRS